jgi:MFS family permease
LNTSQPKITPEPRSKNPSQPSRFFTFAAQTFSALQYHNYRLWFGGQTVSLFGTWMQRTAQGYLIFDLTKSPLYLGYVGFAYGIPSWLFMIYGGAIADRFSRRTILLIAQIAMMVLAFILAALTFTNLVQPWQIIVLAFLLGIANAFDAPARQAFVTELVDRKDLTNAIALNSSMINAATVIGPAVAGITYALFGPAWCFTINGITFLAVIVALLLMKLAPFKPVERAISIFADIKEGLGFTVHQPTIRILIFNLGILSLAGLGFVTLLPVWAVDVLGGDAITNGFLHTARGLGALSGALLIAAVGQTYPRGRLFTIGTFVMPVFLLFFSFTKMLPASFLALLGTGWGFMVIVNLSNTLVQLNVTDELRGRVMGIFTFTFFGFMPLGSLINGALADQLGAPTTIQINAAILLGDAILLFVMFPIIRKNN